MVMIVFKPGIHPDRQGKGIKKAVGNRNLPGIRNGYLPETNLGQ
jgi:hypothetical protein